MKIIVTPDANGDYCWPQGTYWISEPIMLPVGAVEPFEVEVDWGVPDPSAARLSANPGGTS